VLVLPLHKPVGCHTQRQWNGFARSISSGAIPLLSSQNRTGARALWFDLRQIYFAFGSQPTHLQCPVSTTRHVQAAALIKSLVRAAAIFEISKTGFGTARPRKDLSRIPVNRLMAGGHTVVALEYNQDAVRQMGRCGCTTSSPATSALRFGHPRRRGDRITFAAVQMSPIGTKRTSRRARSSVALGGESDVARMA
jgi:hypothetical protein